MDTVTQIVLGGTIAEAGFRHKLGIRSIFFGALCGWLPDIDIFFHDGWEELVEHRGLTHSILFLTAVSPLVGEIGCRLLGNTEQRWKWMQLAFWTLITHPLLDWNTSYGTQLLYPFSQHRFALDSIAIVDLLYTVPLIVAFVWSLRSIVHSERSQRFARYSLMASSAYLLLGWMATQLCISRFTSQLQEQNFSAVHVRSNPIMLFSPLRRIAARNKDGQIAIGLAHVFSRDVDIDIYPTTLSTEATTALDSKEGEIFQWYSDGFLIAQENEDSIVFRIALFGLLENPWDSPFAARSDRTNTGFGPLILLPRGESIDPQQEFQLAIRKTLLLDDPIKQPH